VGRIVKIIHYSALPVIGGVEFIISKHKELMANDGIDVTVIAGDGNPDILIPELKASYYKKIQKEILNGCEPDNFKNEVNLLENKLIEVISSTDLLIVHNLFTMHFNLVATAALTNISKDIRTIAWVHDIAYLDPTYKLPPPDIPQLKLIKSPMDYLEYVTITKYRKELLIDFLDLKSNRVSVISNGIDPYVLLPKEMKKASMELDILSYYPVVIYPSRLTRRKNYELAIEIISELEDNPLLLLSAPPDPHNPAFVSYKDELIELADEKNVNIVFLSDYIPIKDIYPFYFLGDILLISSRMEGFGLPVLEAALTRIPAALSNIPPLRELGEHFKNTLSFNLDENPKDIALKISNLLKNSKTIIDRREVISNYSWERIYKEKIKKLLEVS
jgi:glycosyltransferase involved in cell wall biosynthesis